MTEPSIAQAHLVIPSSVEYLPSVRDLIESSAEQMGFEPQEVQRVVTAAFEAVVNAITHGSPRGTEDTVRIDILIYDNKFEIRIADQGPGFTVTSPSEMPDVSSPRGRGLPLMQALVDEVHISNTPSGKITLIKHKP